VFSWSFWRRENANDRERKTLTVEEGLSVRGCGNAEKKARKKNLRVFGGRERGK